jgi:hypothetical protein
VGGSCTDNAGKTASATSDSFRYDASPPVLTLSAKAAHGVVVLHWTHSDIAPLASLAITRTPGRSGAPASVVYSDLGSEYRDRSVSNGVRYRYTLSITDQAGNTSRRSLGVTPGARLLGPVAGERVSTPPILHWTPVRRATYYNVQLYRGRKKILSAWPARPRLQLKAQWSFEGRRYRLQPGRYHWYVWPGFGKRSAVRYGAMIGKSTFVRVRSS